MSALADRLRSRCVVDDNGCWIWQGSKSMGYGTKRHGGTVAYVHRLMYELLVAPIPAGLTIDHLCRVRACCNPAHLEPVTIGENTRRAPESMSSINRAKTHCPQGHPYSGDNLRIERNGARDCRTCSAATERQRVRPKDRCHCCGNLTHIRKDGAFVAHKVSYRSVVTCRGTAQMPSMVGAA